MNRIILSLIVFSSVMASQIAIASENKLSRSCLKSNPVMAGETDAKLIELYEDYCDKKNADSKYSYLARAAQRFQQIGQNYKALQIVGELETLNLRGSTITDVKFLASANLANEALTNMRTTESRYLTSDVTYPIAKQLSENIQSTKSNIILKMESPVKTPSKKVSTTSKATAAPKPSVKKKVSSSTPAKSKATSPVKSAPSNAGSGSPFDFTKK